MREGEQGQGGTKQATYWSPPSGGHPASGCPRGEEQASLGLSPHRPIAPVCPILSPRAPRPTGVPSRSHPYQRAWGQQQAGHMQQRKPSKPRGPTPPVGLKEPALPSRPRLTCAGVTRGEGVQRTRAKEWEKERGKMRGRGTRKREGGALGRIQVHVQGETGQGTCLLSRRTAERGPKKPSEHPGQSGALSPWSAREGGPRACCGTSASQAALAPSHGLTGASSSPEHLPK